MAQVKLKSSDAVDVYPIIKNGLWYIEADCGSFTATKDNTTGKIKIERSDCTLQEILESYDIRHRPFRSMGIVNDLFRNHEIIGN